MAILAGGQGTRLVSRSGCLPKAMVSVLGKPVLQHQIELCRAHGFVDIALLVHYRHAPIINYFGDGLKFGVHLEYIIEKEPRGTAGALLDSLSYMAERFLLLYGDTFVDVDLTKFWNAHLESGAVVTLFLHPNDHPHDSDLVELDSTGRVTAIHPYPHPAGSDFRNLVNAALYAVDQAHFEGFIPADCKTDLAKHTFPAMLSAGLHLNGYVSPEYIKDMGTPERLDKVERDIEFGLPERLSNRNLRSAIFIDRDGTINCEVNHLAKPEQITILPGAGEAIRRINRSGYLAIVVTNQPVLARGEVTFDDMGHIHSRLESMLGQDGAFLDGIYFCPHHPERGFVGEVSLLKCDCNCRKPLPGLIDQACKDMAIARSTSWMIGDSSADMLAGRNANLRTVLVRTGHAGLDDKYSLCADYVVPDLSAAVDWILDGHKIVSAQLCPVLNLVNQNTRLVLLGGQARAGKSFVSQVLKEHLEAFGYIAHVISLDAWIKYPDDREEGQGVFSRYDMARANSEILALVKSQRRVAFKQCVYNRASRHFLSKAIHQSVGAQDIIIVEGVTALMSKDFRLSAQLKLYVELDETIRQKRFEADYRWRGMPEEELSALLNSRKLDEVQVVSKYKDLADFVINVGNTPAQPGGSQGFDL